MAKVILRQKAIEDLDEIWDYTLLNWSEKQAFLYYNSIRISCAEIGKNPKIGRSFNQIGKNILGLKSGRHIIFYQQISTDKIEVLRILHERMDIEIRLDK